MITPEEALVRAATALDPLGFHCGRYGEVEYALKTVEYTFTDRLRQPTVAAVGSNGGFLAVVQFDPDSDKSRVQLLIYNWLHSGEGV